VGLVERFDESIVIFQNAFGWRAPYYAKGMVNHTRPHGKMLSPEILDWLIERHQLDLELYAFGESLFNKQVAAQPNSFATRVDRFRRANKIIGPGYNMYSRAVWKLNKMLNAH
jgi:hypothetical protein